MRAHEESGETLMSPASLQALLKVQGLDDQIKRMVGQLDRRPADLESQRRQTEAQRRRRDEAKKIVTDTQKRIDERTVSADALHQDALKLEGQLYSLKSNDEFNIMKGQIRTKQTKEQALQDEVLEFMVSLDDLKVVVAEEEKSLKYQEELFQKAEKVAAEELARLKGEIDRVQKERAEVIEGVAPAIRDVYEAVAAKREKVGLCAVEDEVCQGCFTRVMMQTVNAVIGGRFVQCPHCERILYLRV